MIRRFTQTTQRRWDRNSSATSPIPPQSSRRHWHTRQNHKPCTRMRLFRVLVLVYDAAFSNDIRGDSESIAEARSVSRPFDRVPRRASPGLDTDLSSLGLSFLYPGDVRFFCNTIMANSSQLSNR